MSNLINKLKYFLQFIVISFLLLIFKILGLKISRQISTKILSFFGPIFKSRIITKMNIDQVFPNEKEIIKKQIIKDMWASYGKIFAEYNFIKNFRELKHKGEIEVEGQNILEEIKNSDKPVIFISGHFDNFELMAMHIERSGIDLAAVYRPLNNFFLNPLMENIRKKYICKKQVKKGISGTKDLLKYFKLGTSLALMIDQRVSEGIKIKFFGREALTTTIPAQFVRKFNCKVVPIHIIRKKDDNFKLKILSPLFFSKNDNIETITLSLNSVLEKMIVTNPGQWIWTHNRWK
ncbi:lysophospholipid acyltransferase family protein [Candidatus Pelagibacter sp.]|nr:lysophospholipid acyltransferase family protein [Candidatus Pelagibacter sp.]